jgi:tryptophanyl-tRNA synthetase
MKNILSRENKKRVYSGIRATGRLHLGNYFGAVKGMLALQENYDCIFSVVDLHTITVPYDVKTLKHSVREIILDYLAAGLDPEKCNLEIQSQVPQHTELAYLLSTIYPVSRLEDLPTYKDKKAQYPKYINMGLLYYPVLMAADVLLYKGELVPVGIDQEPHLEVMREIARKFNSMFGDPSTSSGSSTFPEPQRFKTEGEHVPSLSGGGKMSKSVEGSYINLTDDLETIRKRLAQAPTDSGTTGGEVPKEGGVANLFKFLKLFKLDNEYKKFEQDYREKKISYKDLKEVLAQAIYKELKPFQERRKEFLENPKLVDSVIQESLEKCRQMAEETMREVRGKMGLT